MFLITKLAHRHDVTLQYCLLRCSSTERTVPVDVRLPYLIYDTKLFWDRRTHKGSYTAGRLSSTRYCKEPPPTISLCVRRIIALSSIRDVPLVGGWGGQGKHATPVLSLSHFLLHVRWRFTKSCKQHQVIINTTRYSV